METENVNAVEEEEYHFEKQEMINEIYLNRAIAYFKYAYQLAQNQNYASQASLIGDNKDKAVQDLDKFFGQLVADKS